MKNKWQYSLICAALSAVMMILPVSAEEAEAVTEAAVSEEFQVWDSTSNLEDGIFTVYIQSHANDKKGYYWTAYTGDKGDATFYDLVTQSTEEEGYAYVGSFMGLEGETAEDYIRIVHTNGFVTDQYFDFNIRIEDGVIAEHTGGSHAMPTTDENFEPILSGDWEAEDGSNVFLSLALNPEGGFDGIVSDAGGRDGSTRLYTFTAEYDAITGAFLYRNGAFSSAQITDGSESGAEDAEPGTEASEPETEEPAEEAAGEGNGLIAFNPVSENLEDMQLIFHDPVYKEEDITFVRVQ